MVGLLLKSMTPVHWPITMMMLLNCAGPSHVLPRRVGILHTPSQGRDSSGSSHLSSLFNRLLISSSPFVGLRQEMRQLCQGVMSEVRASSSDSRSGLVSSVTSEDITPKPALTSRGAQFLPGSQATKVTQGHQVQPEVSRISNTFPRNGVWSDVLDFACNPCLCAAVHQLPDIVRSSKSKNTNKKYDQYFVKFTEWCKCHSLESLPANVSTVCIFFIIA
ncbi:uncharacterized protein LOC132726106 [Ruditapes philippinarum]|uniref:uncharacterized protein LOC132726106 n=1 Tax=Ruditapes philippinarum TaxID=129788 RepID=UPI00295BA2F9|nr:uncharacterized protein LOC132726106 [Ruditapes philippinarum]